ncbi:MAG: terminase large subunit [Burkholderiales bacterium]
MAWNLSCPGWEAKLRAGKSLIPDLPLFKAEGDRAVAVFNKLRLSDVSGTPYMAEAAGEWFREIVGVLFGSVDPVTQARAIREVFLLVPKKSGKTTYGALLMLVALLLNRRPQASFYFIAPVHDTAEMAFSAAAGAIDLDDVLKKKLHVRDHLKRIVHRETGAELAIMTFDPKVITGKLCAGILVDELHVVANMNGAGRAIRQLRGGMLPFDDAFLMFITTQSEEAPSGVFKAELLTARAIRDGTRTGTTLPIIYEFPRAMQQDATAWRNPENWRMVSPNLGRPITIDRLVEEFDVAQSKGEGETREWASQHLNVEIGLALHSDRWAGADYWEQQARPAFTLDELLARCEVVTVGIDGGGHDDLLGFCVIGRVIDTRIWMVWTHAWAHPDVLIRRKSEAERFRDFVREGTLTITEEHKDDVIEVASIVGHIEASGKLNLIGVDAAGLGGILDALGEVGIFPIDDKSTNNCKKIVAIKQGGWLNGAILTVERKLAEGGLIHGGQLLMNYCIGNAKIEAKGMTVSITKQTSGRAKIDPLSAMLDAAELMLRNPVIAAPTYQMFFVA